MKEIINYVLKIFLKVKIIKFFSHFNGIVVLQNIFLDYFLKISFSKYCNFLLKNEKLGYAWYKTKVEINIINSLRNCLFLKVLMH